MLSQSIFDYTDLFEDAYSELSTDIWERAKEDGIRKRYRKITQTRHSEASVNEEALKIENFSDVDYGITLDWEEHVSYDVRFEFAFTGFNRLRIGGYGSAEPFSRIYTHLVRLNGSDFIQEYFDNFLETDFGARIGGVLEDIYSRQMEAYNEALGKIKRNKEGEITNGKRAASFVESFAVWNTKEAQASLDEVAWAIKRNIVHCLATGKINLNFTLSKEAKGKRMKAGLSPLPTFFATGQLIDNLIVRVLVEEAA